MKPAVFLIEAADPTGSVVVVAMPSEHAVHLIDELQGQVFEFLAFRLLIKAKKVTDRESVSP
jgi:helix-turn-helix protein